MEKEDAGEFGGGGERSFLNAQTGEKVDSKHLNGRKCHYVPLFSVGKQPGLGGNLNLIYAVEDHGFPWNNVQTCE